MVGAAATTFWVFWSITRTYEKYRGGCWGLNLSVVELTVKDTRGMSRHAARLIFLEHTIGTALLVGEVRCAARCGATLTTALPALNRAADAAAVRIRAWDADNVGGILGAGLACVKIGVISDG